MTTITYIWYGEDGQRKIFNSWPAVKEYVEKNGGQYRMVENEHECHRVLVGELKR